MSFVKRLWNAIRSPIRFVGRDLEGNRFYERPNLNDSTRTTRSVEYRDPEDMWKYTGGGKRLSIQWSAWMTHTRFHPPTIEELQSDVARQQRVLANVALIEARDRAEEQERMRIRQENQNNISQRTLAEFHSSAEQERSGRQNDSADDTKTKTTGSDIQGEQKVGLEGEVKEVAERQVLNSDDTLVQTNGPKIRPPAFLTPAKPLKSQTTTPISSFAFTAPSDVLRNTGQSAFGREHQCQQKKADSNTEPLDSTTESAASDSTDVKKQKSTNGGNPLPVMPSRATETESWVPKARARRG